MKTLAFLLACTVAASAQEPVKEPEVGKERLLLRTTMGDMLFAFYPKEAPKTVEQFIKLTRLGVYDTYEFYRVHRAFVAQVVEYHTRVIPLLPSQQKAIVRLPLEGTQIRHARGILSMAHADGDVNSAETSFSILLGEAPHLNGSYTAFGKLEQGIEVLEAINEMEVNEKKEPLKPFSILKAEIIDSPDDLLTLALRGPPPPGPAPASVPTGEGIQLPGGITKLTLVLLGVMMAIGGAIFMLVGKLSPKVIGSLGLLVILVGFFYIWVTLVPAAYQSKEQAAGILLFFGSLCLFKLMNRFESPR